MQTKQLILSLIAFVAILLSSCSDEQAGIGTGSGGTQTLSFRLTTEEQAQTRAGSGAPTVSGYKLMYHAQILDAAGETIAGSNASSDQGKFTFNLPVGTSYTCLFWAHYVADPSDTESDYFNVADLKAVTLKQHLTGADECQAFCGTTTVTVATGTTPPATTTVTLKRAVAQVNIKSDTKLTGYSKLDVDYTDVPNTFNVKENTVSTTSGSGIVSGNPATITVSTFPTNPDTGGSQYTCQSAYFLAPTGATAGVLRHLLGIEVKTYNAGSDALIQTLSIANVPTEKNFKTNVVVNFDPASVTHQYTMNVNEWENTELEPNFPSVWDGVKPTGNSGGSTFSGGSGTADVPYLISSAADLAQLAADVNAGCTYEVKYFKLTKDIDLNNKAWDPIGWETADSKSPAFKGHFDGAHHTVSNLSVSKNDGSTNLGLFGMVNEGFITGLHVKGTVAYSGSQSSVRAGGLAGYIGVSTVKECSFEGTVTNASTDRAAQTAGGLIGFAAGSSRGGKSFIIASKFSGSVSCTTGPAGGLTAAMKFTTAVACYADVTSLNGGDGIAGIAVAAWGPAEGVSSIAGCYVKGAVLVQDAVLADNKGKIDAPCYSTEAVSGTNQHTFDASTWPSSSATGDVWYAAPTNDGTYTSISGGTFTDCKFWKSLGNYNGGTNPEYPKLWWEN